MSPSQTEGNRQRAEALAKANAVRFATADMKRKIADGEMNISEVLENPPEYVRNLRIDKLLILLPRVGRQKARLMLRNLHINPGSYLCELTDRQRQVIARGIKEKAWTQP